MEKQQRERRRRSNNDEVEVVVSESFLGDRSMFSLRAPKMPDILRASSILNKHNESSAVVWEGHAGWNSKRNGGGVMDEVMDKVVEEEEKEKEDEWQQEGERRVEKGVTRMKIIVDEQRNNEVVTTTFAQHHHDARERQSRRAQEERKKRPTSAPKKSFKRNSSGKSSRREEEGEEEGEEVEEVVVTSVEGASKNKKQKAETAAELRMAAWSRGYDGAVLIQRTIRKCLARLWYRLHSPLLRKERDERMARQAAAKSLQRQWLLWKDNKRRATQKMTYCVVCLQSCYRGRRERFLFQKILLTARENMLLERRRRNEACVHMQRVLSRGVAGRVRAAKKRERRKEARRFAACMTMIMAWRRCVVNRLCERRKEKKMIQKEKEKRRKKRNVAAMLLQKMERGRRGRDVGRVRRKLKREQEERSVKNAASVVLQCRARGMLVRFETMPLLRMFRKEKLILKRKSGAVNVQRWYRGVRGRSEWWLAHGVEEKKNGAVKIQQYARGHAVRCEWRKRRKKAAKLHALILLQSAMRRFLRQKELRLKLFFALKIECWWRCCSARVKIQKRREIHAAIQLQTWWQRLSLQEREKNAAAAARVQSIVRGWSSRTFFRKKIKAAVRVQCTMRRVLARGTFLLRREEEFAMGSFAEYDEDGGGGGSDGDSSFLTGGDAGGDAGGRRRRRTTTPTEDFLLFSKNGIELSAKVFEAVRKAEEVARRIERDMMGIETHSSVESGEFTTQLREKLERSRKRLEKFAAYKVQ